MDAKLNALTFSLIALLTTSCDYLIDYTGFVLDARTEMPIKNGTVEYDRRQYKTDSLGYFDFHYMSGKPHPTFIISKDNYLPTVVSIDHDDNSTIYKVEDKIEWNGKLQHFNSPNFRVKNDTLTFYLMPVEN